MLLLLVSELMCESARLGLGQDIGSQYPGELGEFNE
jgi:hypothetical protein